MSPPDITPNSANAIPQIPGNVPAPMPPAAPAQNHSDAGRPDPIDGGRITQPPAVHTENKTEDSGSTVAPAGKQGAWDKIKANLVAALEKVESGESIGSWQRMWDVRGGAQQNLVTKHEYSGGNALSAVLSSVVNGWGHQWCTFNAEGYKGYRGEYLPVWAIGISDMDNPSLDRSPADVAKKLLSNDPGNEYYPGSKGRVVGYRSEVYGGFVGRESSKLAETILPPDGSIQRDQIGAPGSRSLAHAFHRAAYVAADEFRDAFDGRIGHRDPRTDAETIYKNAVNAAGSVAYKYWGKYHSGDHRPMDDDSPVYKGRKHDVKKIASQSNAADLVHIVGLHQGGESNSINSPAKGEMKSIAEDILIHKKNPISRVAEDIKEMSGTILKNDYFREQIPAFATSLSEGSKLDSGEKVALDLGLRFANATWKAGQIHRAAWEGSTDRVDPAVRTACNPFDKLKTDMFSETKSALMASGKDEKRAGEMAFSRVVFESYKDLVQIKNAAENDAKPPKEPLTYTAKVALMALQSPSFDQRNEIHAQAVGKEAAEDALSIMPRRGKYGMKLNPGYPEPEEGYQLFEWVAKNAGDAFRPAFDEKGLKKEGPADEGVYKQAVNAAGPIAYRAWSDIAGKLHAPSDVLERANAADLAVIVGHPFYNSPHKIIDQLNLVGSAAALKAQSHLEMASIATQSSEITVLRAVETYMHDKEAVPVPKDNIDGRKIASHVLEMKDTILKDDYFKSYIPEFVESVTQKSQFNLLEREDALQGIALGLRLAQTAWRSGQVHRAAWEGSIDRIDPEKRPAYNSFDDMKANLYGQTKQLLVKGGESETKASEMAFARVVFESYKDLIQLKDAEKANASG